MRNDLIKAISQMASQRGLPETSVVEVIENALTYVYRRAPEAEGHDIKVKIEPNSGAMSVVSFRTVVEDDKIEDMDPPLYYIGLSEARQSDADIQVGDIFKVKELPNSSGRTMAHTTRQMIMQNLREAERNIAFEQFKDKENKLLTGEIQRIEQRSILVKALDGIAVMPSQERSLNERYRVGQRLKFFVAKVGRGDRGLDVVLSRSHPDLLRRLFETEVPEIKNGSVEIKAIAREAGSRSKIAVHSDDPDIDPVGTCIGLRGIRIQNIVGELNGEKVDVIEWKPAIDQFIINSLNPATVASIEIDEERQEAKAYVARHGQSLAIGREGQNVRLAAKLTNWSIDVKSAESAQPQPSATESPKPTRKSAAEQPAASAPPETEKVARPSRADKKARKQKVKVEAEVDVETLEKELEALTQEKPAEQPAAEAAPPVDTLDFDSDLLFIEPDKDADESESEIRFAEDIGEVRMQRSGDGDNQKAKRGKKRTRSNK